MAHWLNGDGHVSAFRFANGSVDYKGRYVKTDRLMAERRHRRRLWGVYRNYLTDDRSSRMSIAARPTRTFTGTAASCS